MTGARHPNHRERSTLPPELRRTTVPPAVRAWIAREAGSAVRAVVRLPGASTSAVHRVHLVSGSTVVLRRYVWPYVLEDDPAAPRREVDALTFAAAHGLAAPAVVAADLTGDDIGDGTPAVLMTFVRGRAVAVPDLTRLAEVAAAIHAVDPAGFGHDYAPWWPDDRPGPPAGWRRPDLWARALGVRAGPRPAYRPVFVHRDFHPGNVLWTRGRCTGVVDWVNACRGPAGCDVAHCRANLALLAGRRAADQFVAAYEALAGRAHDPYWDVASVLEHGSSEWTPRSMAAAELRLERALAELRAAGFG